MAHNIKNATRSVFLILILLVALFSSFMVSAGVYASKEPARAVDPCIKASDSIFCQEKRTNPPGGDPIDSPSSPILGPNSLFYKIIQTVTLLTGAVSIIMIMVGGFKYIVSGGDGPAIKAAKDTILYAVVGLVVAIFAQTIITFVLSNI